MRIVKFEGASMREALAKVKAELGDQAVIVSSRQIRKGLLGQAIELAAAIEDDTAPAAPPSPRFISSRTPTGAPPRAQPPAPRRPALDDDEVARLVAPLRAELRSLRAIVRARADDKPADVKHELAALRKAVEELQRPVPAPAAVAPPSLSPGHATIREAIAAAAAAVVPAVPLALPSSASQVMLVGPTGVGKTTTIAKIAAHAALVENKRVALVTLDTYRVGGIEQIRTFADLIGVPLYVVEDPTHLASQLEELADYDLTLVDTAGKSPRDRTAIASLTRAIAPLAHLEVHLTVAAHTSAGQLDELARRFAPLRPQRLLFTKVDECEHAPELTGAPARLGLPVTWLATGQAVPEDLELATAPRLAELALTGLAPSRQAA